MLKWSVHNNNTVRF